MDPGFLDNTGYPIGSLYFLLPYEAKARGLNLRSRDFQDNREIFIDLGIPQSRIMTVSPMFIATVRKSEVTGYTTDYDEGDSLPKLLI